MTYNLDDAIIELRNLSISTPIKIELPNEQLISEYEKKLGLKFPNDYKKFLMDASDVVVGTIRPLVLTKNVDIPGELSSVFLEAKKAGIPNDWLPICEDNGDYYCILPNGTIRFWSHDGLTNESWPNLATWIKKVWINGD